MRQVYDGPGRVITIYEHSEARDLIRRLAIRYGEDFERISRGGRNRNIIEYYRFPCSFDIETTTLRSGQLDYVHPDGRPIAIAYLCQFCIWGKVIMVRTVEEALDIFGWLAEFFKTGPKRRLVIFDHNLSYEWGFFRGLWDIDPDQSFALDVHHPATIMLKSGIMIRDSYKMTNMSLETLTKDWSRKWRKRPEIMDYGKLRTPYDELDDQTLLYSALDVLSLSDAIYYYLKARDTSVWTKSPTSTSFVRFTCRRTLGVSVKHRTPEQKRYIRLLKILKITPDIYAMELRQARGGNTHTNRRITGILIERALHGDIGSSYPTQMVCIPEFQIGPWRPLDPDAGVDNIKLLEANGYTTLFDIVLINPRIKLGVTVPYLANSKVRTLKGMPQYSDNGRYLAGSSMLETTIYGIEWPIIERQYDFDDTVILRGYFARKGYLPDILRRFILDLYAKKTQLKGVEGQEVEYALAKTYVNSIYGMAYTRPIRTTCQITENGSIVEGEAPDIAEVLEKYQKSSAYFMPYSWGAMTATLGRVHLQQMIDAVGDAFLYCDTDSVFADNPERSREALKKLDEKLTAERRKCGLQLVYKDIKGRDHELGTIDEEPEVAFKSWGAKKYITVDRDGTLQCTIAGVPKKAGAKIIGTPDNFELGLVFRGEDTNKLCLWYNDDEGLILHDSQGRPIRTYANVAMLPVNYVLGLSDDYRLCLQVEGVNGRYGYSQLNNDMVEDYI